MSASQQKRLRQQQREEGTEKRQIAQKKVEKAIKRSTTRKTSFGIVAAVIILVIIALSSNIFYSNFTAVKIGDVNYSAAEYNFFYKDTIRNFENQYGQYLTMFGLDTTKPLDQQQFEEGKTWAQYFKESALSQMKEVTALYSEAQKEGFVLSDKDKASLDAAIESFKKSNEGTDFADADSYLQSIYGKGCTVNVISGLLEKEYIASAFATQKNDSFTYTSDQLTAYYAENKNNLDKYTYISYFADGSKTEDTSSTGGTASSSTDVTASPSASPEATGDTATAADPMEKAKTTADAIVANATTVEEFKQAVVANAQKEASESTTQGSSLSADYADWLKDASRVAGDKTVIKTETGYYALYFISRDNNNYNTVNVRHILIKAVADANGAYTDEAKATAKQKAEDLLNEWKAGAATEDSFAELANKNSEDPGSNTKGGLYEDISKGQMVTTFNDWCFAEGRKTGDTGIVSGESSSYSGYHVIYFVGQGKLYSSKVAEDELRNKDFTDWKNGILANYEPKNGFTEFLVK